MTDTYEYIKRSYDKSFEIGNVVEHCVTDIIGVVVATDKMHYVRVQCDNNDFRYCHPDELIVIDDALSVYTLHSQVLTAKAPTGKTCKVCFRPIVKGQEYETQHNTQDGQFWWWTSHTDCEGLYNAINDLWNAPWDDPCWPEDYEQSELDMFRGRFPHAVTRIELHRALARGDDE